MDKAKDKKQPPLLAENIHNSHKVITHYSSSVDLLAADVYAKNRHKMMTQTNHNCNHKTQQTTQQHQSVQDVVKQRLQQTFQSEEVQNAKLVKNH